MSVEIVRREIDVETGQPCTASARCEVTSSWFCRTPSSRNGASTMTAQSRANSDTVRTAVPCEQRSRANRSDRTMMLAMPDFVLECQEDESFRRSGTLMGDPRRGFASRRSIGSGIERIVASARAALRHTLHHEGSKVTKMLIHLQNECTRDISREHQERLERAPREI